MDMHKQIAEFFAKNKETDDVKAANNNKKKNKAANTWPKGKWLNTIGMAM